MHATIRVEHEDDNGVAQVPPAYHVLLEYERIVDPNYGADADGNRGIRLTEYDVTWVDPDPKIPEWARSHAIKLFEDNPGRYT